MRKTWNRLAALLLTVLLIFPADSGFLTALAAGEENTRSSVQEDAGEKTELERMDLDPETLHVKRLGETEEEEPVESAEDPEALVRISVFLARPGAVSNGYSMENVGTNASAAAYREQLRTEQQTLTAEIERRIGYSIQTKWNLTLLTNAISCTVKLKDIPVIKAMSGVKSVERERQYAPETGSSSAEPNTANTSAGMTGAQAAWTDGYSGAGSRIAIIDTGIDTSHQSFAADPFNKHISELGKTSELMTQADVTAVKSQLNSGSSNYVSTKIPYGYNYVDENTTINHLSDTQGEHGSHVAGIAAANYYIKSGTSYLVAADAVHAVGMAPDAQLLIMKVFGSSGGAYDSDYMAAIEDAIVLGCDAVNLSLGSAVQGWSYAGTYQEIMNNLASAKNPNMVVSISAGNSYALTAFMDTDLYIEDVYMHTGGSPGSFINSLGVAAAQNIGATGTPMTFNGSQTVYYTETESTSGGTLSSIAGTYDYVYIDAVGNTADYQAVNSAQSLSGKIVIVNRGDISFYEKGNNATSYSPKALIVANNASGSISMDLTDYTGTFPMVSITLSDAEGIKAASTQKTTGSYTYYTGSVTVTNTTQSGTTTTRDKAEITDFSSWGVPGSLLMKPEITAPGGDIYSVWGTNKTSSGTSGGSAQYELMSGTSMAAPHITGLAAVLAQYLRENDLSKKNAVLTANYSIRAINQSLLMSTATPMKEGNNYYPILRQGAGLAEVSRAARASSVIMMDDAGLTTSTGAAADGKVKAELGDDPERTGVYRYSFTIYNITGQDLTFALSTDIFTQDRETDGGSAYMSESTTLIPANVSYAWEAIGASSESHDVDRDGDTDNEDAQAILDYLTGARSASGLDLEAADMDGDGKVTTQDAQLLIDWEGAEGSVAANEVPAGGKRQVTVTIRLTDKDTLNADYPNGAYLEGFTYVTCSTTSGEGLSYAHEHSIPILGFYGSWTDPSIFDNTSYIDTLYGTAKTSYTGNTDTNYLTIQSAGTTAKFSGNPYIVEESFPEDRLAISNEATVQAVYYNLVRAAGTTGFAVSKLDHVLGDVTNVLASSVTGNSVEGIYYYVNGQTWYNLTRKNYSINKAISSYGLSEGDAIRIGYYAIPEYNGMLYNKADMTDAGAGQLSAAGFRSVLLSNVLGRGAFVGYDFTIDNTAPVITEASLSGNTLTVTASDNQNLAYVAVLSLDGTVKYAEAAPGSSTYTVTLDASKAIADAEGYVAVFAGDYAGNEAAQALKVNDNTYDGKSAYVLTDTVRAGKDYLIVSANSAGTAYALYYTLNTSGTTATVGRTQVTVKAGEEATDNAPYVELGTPDAKAVWTAGTGSAASTYTFNNDGWYLRSSNNNNLTITKDASRRDWSFDGTNSRLSNNSRYLRYYNNTFSINTAVNSIYLYEKRSSTDPYTVTSVSVTPSTLDLYKNSTADLTASVTPLTAEDKAVTWSTSNASVAAVDENGRVTAVGAGSATITAASHADPAITASCSVTVTSVDKALNGIVWDEAGDVFFSSFNASSLPTWTKLHNDSKALELMNAFMADSSTLYAGTLDSSDISTVLYTVNRTSYALTEYGTNYVGAFGMARASTRYTGYFIYGYASYLIFGNLAPEEDSEAGGTFSGLPYGLLDLTTTSVGDAYIAGVAAKSVGTTSSTFYFLDETGKIWQTTLTIGSSVSFGTPSLVVDTGIGTSMLYQSIYYDGTYLYWSHQTDTVTELIIINPSSKAIYHAGNFGEGVWPVGGLYVNGSAAPAAAGEETEGSGEKLEGLQKVASREDLQTEEVLARFRAEAGRFAGKTVRQAESGSLEDPSQNAAEEGAETAGEELLLEETGEDSEEETLPEETEEVSEDEMLPEETEEAEPGIPSGGLNQVSAHLPARKARAAAEPETVTPGTPEDRRVTLTFTEETAVTNGLIEITYDPSVLTYEKAESGLTYKSVFADTETGRITFAYASKEEIPAGTVIASFVFGNACADTEITVLTKERNSELALSDTETVTVSGIGHTWGEASYTWTEDNSAVTAQRVCLNDASHVETETVNTTSEVTKPATCTEKGETTYTAVFTNEAFETQTKTVENIEALGHTAGDPVVENRVEPTCETEGGYDEVVYCTVCGEELSRTHVTLAALDHDWHFVDFTWTGDDADGYTSAQANYVCGRDETHKASVEAELTKVSEDATCTEAGTVHYTAEVTAEKSLDGQKHTEEKSVTGAALGHDWSDPTYNWAEDNSEVTATRVCSHDASHIETETVKTISEVTKPAACTEKGETTYTALFTNEAFETQTKTVENIEALGHDWSDPTYTWTEDNSEVTATRVCAHDASHVETETAKTNSEVTKPATCTEKGETTYTAVFTNEAFETQTKTVEDIEALGHTPGEAVKENEKTAACTEEGSYDLVVYCTVCGEELSRTHVTVAALGHDWSDPTYTWTEDNSEVTAQRVCAHDASHVEIETVKTTSEVTKPATCKEKGETTYTAVFTNEAFETQTKTVENIEALDHQWGTPVMQWSEEYIWQTTTWDAITEDDVIAVTMTKDGVTYILTSANGTSALPAADTVTLDESGESFKTADNTKYGWIRETMEGGYALKANGEGDNYLHTPNTNNRLRVGALANDYYLIDLDAETGYLVLKTEAGAVRYLGVYDKTDWRTYTSLHANIADETLGLWKLHVEQKASAVRTCENDPSHTDTADAVITSEVKTPATCTEKGVTTYTATALFEDGTTLTETRDVEDIPALGHTPGEAVIENRVEPTCETEGGYDEVVYCTVCGEELSRTHVTLAALGHDWHFVDFTWTGNDADGYTAAQANYVCGRDETHKTSLEAELTKVSEDATCTEAGTVHYTAEVTAEKSLDGQKHTEEKTVTGAALGHTAGEPVRENEKAPTCTEDGSYDLAVYCTVCGEELSRTHVTVAALGHDWSDPTYAWTEDNSEVTATRVCAHDASHVETETVKTTSEVTKPATCTEKGETTYTAV
ncbi:MAG: S8 family serine peptidase, partial [Lachnospiraceae bacterium]|nr:S8 family serine peptidase [Lachnospiraceae bacterium]